MLPRHRFHSICPYFAMFPETFAEKWILALTKRGDFVLDPFSGRGTTATCALLAGRNAIACDVNDVAVCLTRAKTGAPSKAAVLRRLRDIKATFRKRAVSAEMHQLPEFFKHAFHPETLAQILHLRRSWQWRKRRTDCMLAAVGLGALHGESHRSGFYFSNQMPRTISTKPAYSIKFWQARGLVAPHRDVFEILEQRVGYRYESLPPTGEAKVLQCDMRQLPIALSDFDCPIRCAITSPPYFDVTNFEEDQWLRLWLLGGPETPVRNRQSRDDRHTFEDAYWKFIADMWRSLGTVVAKRGHVVVRLGSTRQSPDQLVKNLSGTSRFSGRRVALVSSESSVIGRRQTDVFRPGSVGCKVEVDCHFQLLN